MKKLQMANGQDAWREQWTQLHAVCQRAEGGMHQKNILTMLFARSCQSLIKSNFLEGLSLPPILNRLLDYIVIISLPREKNLFC